MSQTLARSEDNNELVEEEISQIPLSLILFGQSHILKTMHIVK